MNHSGKEVREHIMKQVVCSRHLCLLEMIVELNRDGGDATKQRLLKRARTSPLYLEDCWGISWNRQTGELESRDFDEDLQNMHVRGYILLEANSDKINLTYRTKILYESIYGEGTFTFQPEKK